MTPGIEVRQRNGRNTFRAVVYDQRSRKKLSRTFDTITAARRWRTDAQAALSAGTITSERGPNMAD
jgi:hypothetical protein